MVDNIIGDDANMCVDCVNILCHCAMIRQLVVHNNINSAAVVVVSKNDWYLYSTNFHNSFI
jgi:hypothetical protein